MRLKDANNASIPNTSINVNVRLFSFSVFFENVFFTHNAIDFNLCIVTNLHDCWQWLAGPHLQHAAIIIKCNNRWIRNYVVRSAKAFALRGIRVETFYSPAGLAVELPQKLVNCSSVITILFINHNRSHQKLLLPLPSLFQYFNKIVQCSKFVINARKPNVGYFITSREFIHNSISNLL